MSTPPARPPDDTDFVTLNRAVTVARLLSGVAHEVNNALQVIGATTELLQGTPGLSASVQKELERIAVQNARAAAAISEVVLFARQKLDVRGRVNLREVATRCVALRSFVVSRARLTIDVDAPAKGRFSVEGNAPLLQLAVLNLIVNAEQALAGRKGGTIHVTVREGDGQVSLRVADNGPGLDAATAERIFAPFFTSRPREDASGLGLAVAKLVAEQHGGTLRLAHQTDSCCFELCLPSAASG